MTDVTIIEVAIKNEMKAFVDLPWMIYRDYPNWVPPLKSDVHKLLDPRRHPFWKFSERSLYLAKRGDKVVGRIGAIVDGNFNERYKTKMGSWGFFECEDDQEAASGLFSAAEGWLKSKGMNRVIGPANPSLNYEVGLLIDGFENKPTLMMTYNPPYYRNLVESCGHFKEKDLISIYFTLTYSLSGRVSRLSKRFAKRAKVSIRPFNLRNFESDMALLRDAYNEIWEDNWGFVPATDAEAELMAKEFRRFADPDLVFFVYSGDDLAGIGMTMPDMNPLLKRLNGHIGLTGLFKFLLYRKKINGIRGMLFGFRKQYQGLGYPLVAIEYLDRISKEKGYQYMELGWNLEDNAGINQFEKECGGKLHNTYRIFSKDL